MQIKKLLALFLALALAVGLAGCGVETENGERPPDTPSVPPSGAVISETEGGANGDSGVAGIFPKVSEYEQTSDPPTQGTTTPSVEKPTIELPQRPEGEFDFDDAMQNIWFDGQSISLPTTLEELGEEYIFSEPVFYLNDEKTLISVEIHRKIDDEFGICSATLINSDNDDYNEKSIIIGLTSNYLSLAPREIGFYGINFLGEKITREQILNFFGDKMVDDTVLIYNKSERQSIVISFFDGRVSMLNIINFKEEN